MTPARWMIAGTVWVAACSLPSAAQAGAARTRVLRLTHSRCSGDANCSQIDVALSRPARARLSPLAPSGALPARLVVDLADSQLGPKVGRALPAADCAVAGVRVAAHPGGRVRIVVDLAQPASGSLHVLTSPPRLRIKVVGDSASSQVLGGPVVVAPPPPPSRIVAPAARPSPAVAPQSASAPAEPASSGRRCVVLDPGHGGHDPGTQGAQGLAEKSVVLAVAREARELLKARGIDVLLTREGDTYLTLEARTALANRANADAFVSIHANADGRRVASGIETYFLNVTDNRYSIRLAARENRTTERQVDDLQMILADLSTKFHSRQSRELAQRVQDSLIRRVGSIHPKVRDLGVKSALFYVLLGARMPSILVETSFLSHPVEGRLLAQPTYQKLLAGAIAEAVVAHLESHPTGLQGEDPADKDVPALAAQPPSPPPPVGAVSGQATSAAAPAPVWRRRAGRR